MEFRQFQNILCSWLVVLPGTYEAVKGHYKCSIFSFVDLQIQFCPLTQGGSDLGELTPANHTKGDTFMSQKVNLLFYYRSHTWPNSQALLCSGMSSWQGNPLREIHCVILKFWLPWQSTGTLLHGPRPGGVWFHEHLMSTLWLWLLKSTLPLGSCRPMLGHPAWQGGGKLDFSLHSFLGKGALSSEQTGQL